MALRLGFFFIIFLSAHIWAKQQNLLSLFGESNAKFASNFYSAVINNKVDGNVIISPFSVQVCGALIYAGAAGTSAEEMVQGLSLLRNDRFVVGDIFLAALENNKNDLLQIANKIFLGKNTEVTEEFDLFVKMNFFSEEQNVDFSKSEQTADTINGWVKNASHNKIDKLFEKQDFDESFFMVLANTIYFKGKWILPFEKTTTRPFWISENETKNVEMMFLGDEDMKYAKLDELDATGVKLDYESSDSSIIVILPNKRTGLKELEEKLSKVDLIDLQKRFRENYVFLDLPKFGFEYSLSLEEPFRKMGMNSIFSNANLSNMIRQGSRKVKIDKAVHKAFIQVTETGTEAGAATGFSAHDLTLPVSVVADHPFFFAIVSNSAVLFMGRYVD